MAEGIAFDLVQGVLGKLGSALWDEIGLLRSFKHDADDLRSDFSAIQAVLLDAEERSSAGKETHALRHWLRKLKDAAYDADGLLDEIRTQAALRQQQHPEVQNQNQPAEKVREFLSHANPMRLKFKVKMAHRMKELREKIGKIAKQRHDFGLAEAGPGRQAEFKHRETFSAVDEKEIVGRDDDKEKFSLPPLGQLPFLEQLTIRNMPAGTVLTVDDEEGRRERVPLFPCLTGLWLKECPQLRPEPCLPPSVKSLDFYRTSKENLSLILERAMPFGGGDAAVSPQPPPDKGLRGLGIDECQQLTCLPESLRSLTSLQRLEIWSCQDLERIEDWLGELSDLQCWEIWGCSSLRYLPAHKMTTLKILHIIGCPLLFDADGQFVATSVDHIKKVIVDGRPYPYEELASSSSKEESSPKLLRCLDRSETRIQELPESITSLYNLQKLNLSRCSSLTILDSVSNLQNLYSLNLSSCQKVRSLEPICHLKNLHYLNLSCLKSLVTLPESNGSLQNLHTLNLSHCNSFVTLPESIGSLQNLHILNVSECCSLQSLPSSSSDLQHLEKLDISDCGKLCELPKMIQKLTKLRVLLNNNCSELKGMPRGIGKLVSLQELSVFVVGKQDCVEHCASISELEHFKLVGQLWIKGLENVTSPVYAKAANLIDKNLRNLKLEWNVLSAEEGMDSVLPAEGMDTVLENLQPHQKLSKLEIEGYGGGKFPSWMMDRIGSCLPNLIICSSLPPLGQLPFLKELIIQNMPATTNLGVEKFTALTSLWLFSMPMLREWVTVLTVDDEEGRRERVPIFPCLTQLWLSECPQLRPEPCLLPSVECLGISRTSKENLFIDDCPLLFDAAEQFVDTSVDHIEEVSVNNRKYPYEEEGCSSPEESESSLKEEEKKGWTSCWSKIELVGVVQLTGQELLYALYVFVI
ncbi:putative disease resistance RPP13-like protein 1 [Ananas comosus]|uniref:Putative disease resistance RPP13-like protein 1 n=1 Tax=Ananas comosus TaxID=4615 RepID=A0A199W2N5_ANACO|nr:putative disease resistance RPP13-like protein 1 [Ananas comosus]